MSVICLRTAFTHRFSKLSRPITYRHLTNRKVKPICHALASDRQLSPPLESISVFISLDPNKITFCHSTGIYCKYFRTRRDHIRTLSPRPLARQLRPQLREASDRRTLSGLTCGSRCVAWRPGSSLKSSRHSRPFIKHGGGAGQWAFI